MAKATGTKTTITASTPSNHFQLGIGQYTVSVTSATWGSAALECSRVGENSWRPVLDSAGAAIVFTSNRDVVVVGNRDYRLGSVTHVADIEFGIARCA